MATAISLHMSLSRTWTGSLADLVSSKHDWDNFVERCTDFSSRSILKYNSELSGLSNSEGTIQSPLNLTNEEVECQAKHVDNLSKSLTFNQRLRLRQLLNHIHSRLFGDPVTESQIKQVSHPLFSSVIVPSKTLRDSNPYTEYGKSPYFLGNHAFSESHLSGKTFENKIAQSICDQSEFASILKSRRRRHCDSGSEVTLPLPVCSEGVGAITKSDNTSLGAFSDDCTLTKHPIPLNPPLHMRYESCENLTDSTLYIADSCFHTESSETPEVHKVNQYIPEFEQEPDVTSPISPTESTDVNENKLKYLEPYSLISIEETSSVIEVLDNSDTSILSSPSSLTTRLNKNVSFADEIGQPLTEIVLIESDYPDGYDHDEYFDGPAWSAFRKSKWPNVSCLPGSATRSRLKNSLAVHEVNESSNLKTMKPQQQSSVPRSTWVARFPQPASLYYGFRQRIENGFVSLEIISVTQSDESSITELPSLSGTIKVKNISFEKQVSIRWTTDKWNSYTDQLAIYNPKLSSRYVHSTTRFDTFTFQIQVSPQMKTNGPCNLIEFAICYTAGPDGSWGQYWDNNNGKNYIFEREITWSQKATSPPDGSPSISPSNTRVDLTPTANYPYDSFGEVSSSESPSCASPLRPYTADYRPNFEGIRQFTNYRAWSHFAGETTYY